MPGTKTKTQNENAPVAQTTKGENVKAFSIKDTKAEGFNTPFFQPTFGLAERAFKNAADDPNSGISKSKEDFSLWYIGDFDHKTGTIVPCEPKHITNA